MKAEEDSICVDVGRDQIKAKLNEVCKTRDEVFIARYSSSMQNQI